MKKLLKLFKSTGFTIMLGICTLAFMLWTFYFGGIEYLELIISLNTMIFLLGAFILGMISFIVVGVIKSVKIENKNKVWRESMCNGDKVHVSTYGGPDEDGEILDIDQEYVSVKIKVSKSRIYKIND